MHHLPEVVLDAHSPLIVELEGVLIFQNESGVIFFDEKLIAKLQDLRNQGIKIYAVSYDTYPKIGSFFREEPQTHDLFEDVITLLDKKHGSYQFLFDEIGTSKRPCVYLVGRYLGSEFWLFSEDQKVNTIVHPEEFGSDRWIDKQIGMAATFWPNVRAKPNHVSIDEQWLAARLLVWLAKFGCYEFKLFSNFDLMEERYSAFDYSNTTQMNADKGAYLCHFYTKPASLICNCLACWELIQSADGYLYELMLDANKIETHVMQMNFVDDRNFGDVLETFVDCFSHSNDDLDQILPVLSGLPTIDAVIADFERANMVIKVGDRWEWTKKFTECYFWMPGYWCEENSTIASKTEILGDAEVFFEAVSRHTVN